eukprot:scaffold6461_cov101-Skeletonema_dohrnii-CCMP3373.AAC.3
MCIHVRVMLQPYHKKKEHTKRLCPMKSYVGDVGDRITSLSPTYLILVADVTEEDDTFNSPDAVHLDLSRTESVPQTSWKQETTRYEKSFS